MYRERSKYEAGVPTNQPQRSIMPGSNILLETLIDAHIFSEILQFILNLKVYLVHMCPTFDNNRSQMKPVLTFALHLAF